MIRRAVSFGFVAFSRADSSGLEYPNTPLHRARLVALLMPLPAAIPDPRPHLQSPLGINRPPNPTSFSNASTWQKKPLRIKPHGVLRAAIQHNPNFSKKCSFFESRLARVTRTIFPTDPVIHFRRLLQALRTSYWRALAAGQLSHFWIREDWRPSDRTGASIQTPSSEGGPRPVRSLEKPLVASRESRLVNR